MAKKSCDVLYIAELILSEESTRKLPLNNVIKHIKNNLETRYALFFIIMQYLIFINSVKVQFN